MYITRQSFLETPDGVNRAFTTSQPFLIGSLLVTQGGLTVSNYAYVENTGILFDVAPDPANGALLWAGEVAESGGIPVAENGFWSVSDFRAVFGVTAGAESSVAFALAKADARLKFYLLPEVYADAQLAIPTDAARAVLVRGAAGELARGYLQQASIISSNVTQRAESYRGIKTYSETFAASSEAALSAAQQEGDILAALSAWQNVTPPAEGADAAGVAWWGTGRWPY